MNTKRNTADFVMAIIFMLIAIYMIIDGFHMTAKVGVKLYESPGLLPIVVGIMIITCAIILFLQCLKSNTVKHFIQSLGDSIKAAAKSQEFINIIVGIFIIGIYTFVLLKLFPFWLASLLLMVILMLFLNAASIPKVLIVSGGTVGLIYLLFVVLFKVPLP